MNKFSALLLLVSIIIVAQSTTFHIYSQSMCLNTSSAGFCTNWFQNGTVQEEVASCFSAETAILTKSGLKYMNELLIGDSILSQNKQGQQVYTQVIGWFHKDQQAQTQYISLSYENGQSIFVSQKHNIAQSFENNQYKFIFAGDYKLNEKIYKSDNMVSSINSVLKRGMYSPMTRNNKYFVYSSKKAQNSRLLAHDFANLRNPEIYETFVNMFINVYNYVWGTQMVKGVKIHPIANFMIKCFGFLME